MVWHDVVWYGSVWHDMVWYGMVWYGMVWYGMVWYGMVWYGMVWFGRGRMNQLPTMIIQIIFYIIMLFAGAWWAWKTRWLKWRKEIHLYITRKTGQSPTLPALTHRGWAARTHRMRAATPALLASPASPALLFMVYTHTHIYICCTFGCFLKLYVRF